MLRATATTEVDSSRRRFSPHFRLDTIPTWALVAHPPHLRFSNNTCRYDGERLAFRQSDVYTVVAGSPEILVACSESCRPLVVLFSNIAIYLSLRTDRTTEVVDRARCSRCLVFVSSSRAGNCACEIAWNFQIGGCPAVIGEIMVRCVEESGDNLEICEIPLSEEYRSRHVSVRNIERFTRFEIDRLAR